MLLPMVSELRHGFLLVHIDESEKLVLAKFVFSNSALFRLISLKLVFERLQPLQIFESRKLSSSELLSCAKANSIVNNKKI